MDPRQPQSSILSSPPPIPLSSTQVPPPVKSGFKLWKIILAVVAVLLFVLGGIYAYAIMKDIKDKNIQQDVISVIPVAIPAPSGFNEQLEDQEHLKSDVRQVASAMEVCWQDNSRAYVPGKCDSVVNLENGKYLGPLITKAKIDLVMSGDHQNSIVYAKLFNQAENCDIVSPTGGDIRYFVYRTISVKLQIECLNSDPTPP